MSSPGSIGSPPVATPPGPPLGRAWTVVTVVIVLAAVAAAWLLVGSGEGFPDELADEPRIDAGPTVEALEGFEVDGTSYDAAVYGAEPNPRYLVLVSDAGDPIDAEAVFSALPAEVLDESPVRLTTLASSGSQDSRSERTCAQAATAAGRRLSWCAFTRDETVGVLVSLQPEDLVGLDFLAKELGIELNP